MIIKFQKPITFSEECGCVCDWKELEKAIKWYSRKPVSRLKSVYLHAKYPAVSIYEDKIHVHRLLMMYWIGRDLDRSEYVHHKDGNKLNNLRDNLEIMWASDHQSITNKGRKQTPDWIKKRISKTANAKRGKKYPKIIYENPELLK